MKYLLILLLIWATVTLPAQTTKKSTHNPNSLEILSASVAAKSCEHHPERTTWVYLSSKKDWFQMSCDRILLSDLGQLTEGNLEMLLELEDLHLEITDSKIKK